MPFSSAIAIQGYAGSFHELAARHYFGPESVMIPCATFGEVVRLVTSGAAPAGLMAIENSIAGSILPNYSLLQRAAVRVTGEVYLRIRQHLLALPGQALTDIREVHSHPVALLQCADFLARYPWQLVETVDTALSARHLRERNQLGVAAVAGEVAARLYDLEVLVPDIHADPENYTRFLVLERQNPERPVAPADKASLYFHTDHQRGSLARVLGCIAGQGFNLSKLQSCPRPGRTWQYYFHADVEFDEATQLPALLQELTLLTDDLQVLGAYPRGAYY
ncbi:MAG: prephenate dehydratase [Hymenobacter sp.]|nr:prephenate dehydratase [Hymenobacter sp.]